jgi:hypothetical protein
MFSTDLSVTLKKLVKIGALNWNMTSNSFTAEYPLHTAIIVLETLKSLLNV